MTYGYVVYKIFDTSSEAEVMSDRKWSACLVHIKRPFIIALEEDYDTAMAFIKPITEIFAKEYEFKELGLKGNDRLIARVGKGGICNLQNQIKSMKDEYNVVGYKICGEELKRPSNMPRPNGLR